MAALTSVSVMGTDVRSRCWCPDFVDVSVSSFPKKLQWPGTQCIQQCCDRVPLLMRDPEPFFKIIISLESVCRISTQFVCLCPFSRPCLRERCVLKDVQSPTRPSFYGCGSVYKFVRGSCTHCNGIWAAHSPLGVVFGRAIVSCGEFQKGRNRWPAFNFDVCAFTRKSMINSPNPDAERLFFLVVKNVRDVALL